MARMQKKSQPSVGQKPLSIVIFGATGDLFQRKLAPALFDLHLKGLLPPQSELIGFGRKPYSNDAFRGLLGDWALSRRHTAEDKVDEFSARARYHQGNLNEAENYHALGALLAERDRARGLCSDKLFYLAVPPALYETVFVRLAHSGLAIPCAPGLAGAEQAWTRVAVEKPFGSDEKEAARLDYLLGKLFSEDQIFRIDHYLAKETVQNILSFRFSNGLFEPLWNREHIDSISIRMFEKEGVGSRGAFYDGIGALRDVGQNHLLQMLALIAMENPRELLPERIRAARLTVLRAVASGGKKMSEWVARGQYMGYRSEAGVSPDSETETFFSLRLCVRNKRWRGVPFVLESGKALTEGSVEISVFFKPAPCLCPARHEEPHQNVLTFGISPQEEITVLFWAKRPGFAFGLEPKRLSFSFTQGALRSEVPDAYERVLVDAIRGDQTLFASTQEVRAEWRIITPILAKWSGLPLHTYEKGGRGPRID